MKTFKKFITEMASNGFKEGAKVKFNIDDEELTGVVVESTEDKEAVKLKVGDKEYTVDYENISEVV